MDRTIEFNSLVGPKKGNNASASPSTQVDELENSSRTGFNNEAAKIGQEIHVAQLKLDELGKCTYC